MMINKVRRTETDFRATDYPQGDSFIYGLGVSNGPIQFESARKIWRSQNLDECSLARAHKNSHSSHACMLGNARKDHSIPLIAVEPSNFFSCYSFLIYLSKEYAHCSTMLLVLGSPPHGG